MADFKSFKVIIAGGSIAGLTFANALESAGIDFIVLERREIAPQLGASIAMISSTGRVFEQLGVWQTMCAATFPLTHRFHASGRGSVFDNSPLFKLVMEKAGRPVLFMERRFCLETLYSNVKDKSRVLANTGVAFYTEDEHGITVITDHGESIKGSILVAADGIHSTIRRLLAESISTNNPQRSKNLTEGKGVSGIVAPTVEGLVFWFLFVKEDAHSQTPNSQHYTDADAAATIEKFGGLNVNSEYTFHDLWEAKIKAGMVSMEEGVIQGPWNNGGRVVFIGDAVHKTTINAGLGGNLVVEGVCNLANELLPILGRSGTLATPEIVAAFQRYEHAQRQRADVCVKLSHYITRYESMDSLWLRFLRWISPWIPESFKVNIFIDYMKPAPILNHLPDPDIHLNMSR
ncbi:hypothetical protein AAE478_001417 [Parahypoxylon ruwenzoriense]